jgi:hypothetical protein
MVFFNSRLYIYSQKTNLLKLYAQFINFLYIFAAHFKSIGF